MPQHLAASDHEPIRLVPADLDRPIDLIPAGPARPLTLAERIDRAIARHPSTYRVAR